MSSTMFVLELGLFTELKLEHETYSLIILTLILIRLRSWHNPISVVPPDKNLYTIF